MLFFGDNDGARSGERIRNQEVVPRYAVYGFADADRIAHCSGSLELPRGDIPRIARRAVLCVFKFFSDRRGRRIRYLFRRQPVYSAGLVHF